MIEVKLLREGMRSMDCIRFRREEMYKLQAITNGQMFHIKDHYILNPI